MVRNSRINIVLLISAILLCVTPSFASIEIDPVATGLSMPVAITSAHDGSNRLFITLQAGQIVIYDGTQVLPTPFLNIDPLVSCCQERGLLSVAFHPDYVNNGFFFINYTDVDGDTVIARYTVSADPNVADHSSAVVLLTVPQPFGNHNGGQLQFGPDGFLYIGMGDGGSGGDPFNNAQNLGTFHGKILRIDVDNGFPYAIPLNNPFIGNPGALDEIWAFGLRNPWRFSFDRLTGDLFVADVGQDAWEEINFQLFGSSGGENYGWRFMEGNHCFNPPANCNDGTLTLPILEYSHSLGCSVTGGYRYRGSQIPQLFGTYLYGDFCSGLLWGATENGPNDWSTELLLDTDISISAFGEDQFGEVYLAHYSAASGAIYRVRPVIDPLPDVKANGSNGPISIASTDNLSVNAALNSGTRAGEEADWWMLLNTPLPPPHDWYYFDINFGWVPGFSVSYQGSLFDLVPSEVLNVSGLPVGDYAFYFAVDMVMNGSVDIGQLHYDQVIVTVNAGDGDPSAELLTNGVAVNNVEIDAEGTKYYKFHIKFGCPSFTVKLGTKDWVTNQDIIVGYDHLPSDDYDPAHTHVTNYTCPAADEWCFAAPFVQNESVKVTDPQGGWYYVMVHNTSSSTGKFELFYAAIDSLCSL